MYWYIRKLIFFVLAITLQSHLLFGANRTIEVKGVVLLGSSKEVYENRFQRFEGVHFQGITPPGNPRTLERILRETLIGKSLDKMTILEGEKAILNFYQKNGRPLTLVKIPKQRVSGGLLQYIVIEGRVGEISYSGNHWTPTKQLQKGIRQKKDKPVDVPRLEKDLIWLNRNPFRNTTMILNPGEIDGTTDIHFLSEDHFPYRIYVGMDNTGFETTGKERFFTGVNFGNLFHLDQRLSYQYTVSTKWGNFYAHTGQYIIPLPWRHILEFYGGYSGIHAVMRV